MNPFEGQTNIHPNESENEGGLEEIFLWEKAQAERGEWKRENSSFKSSLDVEMEDGFSEMEKELGDMGVNMGFGRMFNKTDDRYKELQRIDQEARERIRNEKFSEEKIQAVSGVWDSHKSFFNISDKEWVALQEMQDKSDREKAESERAARGGYAYEQPGQEQSHHHNNQYGPENTKRSAWQGGYQSGYQSAENKNGATPSPGGQRFTQEEAAVLSSLGLSGNTVTAEQLKKGYRDFQMNNHPDKFMDNPQKAREQEEAVKTVNSVYKSLHNKLNN